MRQKTITMIVTKDPEDPGWYNVVVPSLPGCFTEGRTVREAISNGQEAIALYLDTLEDDDIPVPTEAAAVAVGV